VYHEPVQRVYHRTATPGVLIALSGAQPLHFKMFAHEKKIVDSTFFFAINTRSNDSSEVHFEVHYTGYLRGEWCASSPTYHINFSVIIIFHFYLDLLFKILVKHNLDCL